MTNSSNILIVEDLNVAQKVAINILTKLGCRTEVAKNGAHALELILRKRYDLVLLDIDLPDLNGFSISETIRSLERSNKHIPIVALTANSTEDLGRKCQQFGIDDYIIKPLTIEKARYTLEKFLKTKYLWSKSA